MGVITTGVILFSSNFETPPQPCYIPHLTQNKAKQ